MAATWSYETPVEFHVAAGVVPQAPASALPAPSRKQPSTGGVDIPQPLSGKLRSSQFPRPDSPPGSPRLQVGSPDNGIPRRGNSTPPRVRTRPPIQSSASFTLGSPQHTAHTARSHSDAGGRGQSTWRAPNALTGPERGLATKWLSGRVTITLIGKGGKDGGELRVFRVSNAPNKTVQQRLCFSHIIPPVDSEQGWGILDVQMVHPSISTRKHGLSIRLMVPRPVEELPSAPPPVPAIPRELSRPWHEKAAAALASSPPANFLSSSHILPHRKRQPSETKFSFSVLPRSRTRSKTVSMPSVEPVLSSPIAENPNQQKSHTGSDVSSTAESEPAEYEALLYLSFKTQRDRDEWFTIFRSLGKLPLENGRQARPHRRLRVGVLDLAEVSPTNLQPWTRRYGDGSSTQPDNISAGSVSTEGLRSSAKVPLSPKVKSESEDARRSPARPGWSWKERMRVELMLDNTLVARTAWTKAQEQGGTPFWGESFQLIDIRPFSTCTLHLLKHRNEKAPILFGKVDLPLVSTFAKTEDERYPVRSISGAVIGEIRLAVHYQEVDVIPMTEYDRLPLFKAELGSKFLYVMGGRGVLEGTTEQLCRIALCEGKLMQRTQDMATIEASSAGSTLFRSTTPLSKAMEVVLRMMCSEFLEASLGPTIRKVLKEGIELRLFYHFEGGGKNGAINFAGVAPIMQLIEMTWANMYANRHLFPNFIRHLLAHLFKKVKEFHDDGNDLLRYKAVSSFVFLRLIGPALMSPHLFNLADYSEFNKSAGLLPSGYQRTLTLVAKVLHQLAFFSDREMLRHQELSLFKSFITKNTEAMIDYLMYLVTPNGPWENEPVSVEIHDMVAERKEFLPEFHGESIPRLTIAGAIDLGADWAICTETWYEKRAHPGFKLTTAISSVEGIEPLIEQYDAFLDNVHELAFPVETVEPLPPMAERTITPCPSRPSLFSVSTADTTPGSDDSHGVIVPVRRLFGFVPSKAVPESETSESSSNLPSLLPDANDPGDEGDAHIDESGGVITPEPAEPLDLLDSNALSNVGPSTRSYRNIVNDSPSAPKRSLPATPSEEDEASDAATPRRDSAPRAFPMPPVAPIQIVRRSSLTPSLSPTTRIHPFHALRSAPPDADIPPPEPTPKSTHKSTRRKRRPTLPHLFLGLGKSNDPPPPLPPMPLDR